MSAFDAFMTGFLGRTTEKVAERKEKASTYFDQQMERARTVGVDALRQRREGLDQTITVARNLRDQANMPEEIVRGLANEGPQALLEAQNIWNEASGRGVQIDETFWENAYKFSTEMTASNDVSLEDFLRQVSGLYGSNLDAAAEEGGDPFGAFVASGLGLNAMSRARNDLESTEVAEGFSAADLLAMEGRPLTTRPLGDTGYSGADLGYVNESVRSASGSGALDGQEIINIMNGFNKRAEDIAEQLTTEYNRSAENPGQEAIRLEAQQKAALEYFNMFPEAEAMGIISQLPGISQYLPQDEAEAVDNPTEEAAEGDITTSTLPPADSSVNGVTIPGDPGPTIDQPITQAPPEGVAPNVIINGGEGPETVTFSRIDYQGNYVYIGENGDPFPISPDDYKEAIATGAATIPQ